MTRKNDRNLHIRLNKETLETAQEYANIRTNGNLSAYIRLLIAEKDVGSDPEVKLRLDNIRREINLIGININQRTKKGNASFLTGSEVEKIFINQERIIDIFARYIDNMNEETK